MDREADLCVDSAPKKRQNFALTTPLSREFEQRPDFGFMVARKSFELS